MAYLSKRVLGWGLFESGDLFIQVNSRGGGGVFFLRGIRANKKYLFVLYFRRIIFYVNIVFIANHVFRSVTKYEIERL